jgi:hypothetical protein
MMAQSFLGAKSLPDLAEGLSFFSSFVWRALAYLEPDQREKLPLIWTKS